MLCLLLCFNNMFEIYFVGVFHYSPSFPIWAITITNCCFGEKLQQWKEVKRLWGRNNLGWVKQPSTLWEETLPSVWRRVAETFSETEEGGRDLGWREGTMQKIWCVAWTHDRFREAQEQIPHALQRLEVDKVLVSLLDHAVASAGWVGWGETHYL